MYVSMPAAVQLLAAAATMNRKNRYNAVANSTNTLEDKLYGLINTTSIVWTNAHIGLIKAVLWQNRQIGEQGGLNKMVTN